MPITSSYIIYSLSNEILQNWAFSRRLASNYSNLWQIQLHMHTQLCESIL